MATAFLFLHAAKCSAGEGQVRKPVCRIVLRVETEVAQRGRGPGSYILDIGSIGEHNVQPSHDALDQVSA